MAARDLGRARPPSEPRGGRGSARASGRARLRPSLGEGEAPPEPPGGRGLRPSLREGEASVRASGHVAQNPWKSPVIPRKKPVHGVQIDPSHPTIVFVTVCTKGRRPWLASQTNHNALRSVWAEARAWLVGHYVLMPDHLHLFAAPGQLEIPLDSWVRYWKSRF